MLFFLSAFLLGGCADTEQPYVGYITIKRAVVEAAANSTATITADTDIDSPIELKSIDFGATPTIWTWKPAAVMAWPWPTCRATPPTVWRR